MEVCGESGDAIGRQNGCVVSAFRAYSRLFRTASLRNIALKWIRRIAGILSITTPVRMHNFAQLYKKLHIYCRYLTSVNSGRIC